MQKNVRRHTGNALPLMVGAAACLLLLLCFALSYSRFLGGHEEQRTATEAAALAGARELSRIVIEDPYFGFVGLSDAAPNGSATSAGDNYCLSVTGINTLLATVRLDMIVADYLQDATMAQLAANDYSAALQAKDRLNAALASAIQPGGSGTDIAGNTVTPLRTATQAYKDNLVRMTGGKTNLVPDSMTLTLGYVRTSGSHANSNSNSNTPIPQPVSCSSLSANQIVGSAYAANVVIYYGTHPFVFAALGTAISLVDQKSFVTSIAGLPYGIPVVVKCDADEQFTVKDESGVSSSRIVHATAAAQSASTRDPRPAPGAFTISITGGPVPEVSRPGDLFDNSQLMLSPCDAVQTALSGDYPTSSLSFLPISLQSIEDKSHPQFGEAFSIAFYDWIRRAGTNPNIKSLVGMLNQPFGQGPVHFYQVASDGSITAQDLPLSSGNLAVSQKQWRACSGLALFSSNLNAYDLILTDYVYNAGRINGGKHAGEPSSASVIVPQPNPDQAFFSAPLPYLGFSQGTSVGTVRPTYQAGGIAVDYAIRLRNTTAIF